MTIYSLMNVQMDDKIIYLNRQYNQDIYCNVIRAYPKSLQITDYVNVKIIVVFTIIVVITLSDYTNCYIFAVFLKAIK